MFVDTYALIAWLNPKDTAHNVVKKYLSSYSGRLVTTEWILMEVADALSQAKPGNRRNVIEFLQAVRADSSYEIVGYDIAVYRSGFDLFSTRDDKDWSLTDCISFAVMQERNLFDALTADHHFTQAGFHAIFQGA